MLIKYLTIQKSDKVIRHIQFKPGVNLIVDSSSISNEKQSGNNVGKTTLLRLVDYCLGAEAKAIYQDPEFKNTNTTVKSFLAENVIITLCLGTSFSSSTDDIIIRRNFLPKKQKIAEINGENFISSEDYSAKLKQRLFNLNASKPTLRELIPRFIRSDASKMDKVIRYLHNTTTDNTYEGIYLFLFGKTDSANFSGEKNDLARQLQFNKKVISDAFKSRTAAAIKQYLSVITSEIEQLEEDKKNFNINHQYEREFSELQLLKKKINNVSSNLSKNKFRLDLLNESINELNQQISAVDIESLKSVYSEAKLYIGNLHKSFEDSVKFHNKLISNKLAYISEDLPTLVADITHGSKTLAYLLIAEEEIGKKLVATGSLADYELLVSSVNKKYEQKGRLEEELEKLSNLESEIDRCNTRIGVINKEIKETSATATFENNITEFNKIFSAYSEKFYNEKFILAGDFVKDQKTDIYKYKFTISNVDGNIGDGKKKGLIAAFDLAYISYAHKKKIKTLEFAMHDRIEGIHGNQLKSLFDIVNSDEFAGQYIASVLSGKFSEFQLASNYLEDNKILELSQTDKLFRLEG